MLLFFSKPFFETPYARRTCEGACEGAAKGMRMHACEAYVWRHSHE